MPLNVILTVWFVVTAACVVFLVLDLVRSPAIGGVMKLAWVLVVAYTGPIGLALYWLSCREPKPGTHDEFIRPHWKQATGSLLHCVAGDATGIIISAAIVYSFQLPNGIDLIIEYVSAFVVGLLVFQALFMIRMYDGNYWLAVRKTFFAETVSMNTVMLGMFPVMLILMHRLPDAGNPFHGTFWGIMSLATMAGMITAYPINSWMVARGFKHGMMSAMPKEKPMGEPDHSGMNHGMKETMAMPDQPAMDMPGKMGMAMESMKPTHSGHEASSLSPGTAAAIMAGTFALLFLVLWVVALFVPIVFVRS